MQQGKTENWDFNLNSSRYQFVPAQKPPEFQETAFYAVASLPNAEISLSTNFRECLL